MSLYSIYEQTSIEMADDFSLFSIVRSQAGHKPIKDAEEVVTPGSQTSIFGISESGGLYPFTSDNEYVTHRVNMGELRASPSQDQQQSIQHSWMQGSLHQYASVSTGSIPAQSLFEAEKHGQIPEVSESIKLKPYTNCAGSFEILSGYGRGKGKSRNKNMSNQENETGISGQKLSAEEIMRVAGKRYIQFSNSKLDGITTFIHPYGSALSGLSAEETRGADLAHILLAAAEKVSYKQYDSATKLLAYCESMTSDSGNAVERIIFYFSEALRERIYRETGTIVNNRSKAQVQCPNGLSSGVDLTLLALHQGVPFGKIMQFTSVQIILENVAEATKIHLVDLQIRNGIHWTAVIQTLSERKNPPVDLIKITAVVTTDKEKVEETGKRLESFAKSLNISFLFNVVFVSNMKDLKEEHFGIQPDEAVAVFSPIVLRTMISRPDTLENLIRVIQSMMPKILVVTEVEASHNSTSFVNRFVEALYFYSAWFDSLDDCMNRDSQYRMEIERIQLGKGIQNIVATEGEERIIRSVKINVWRDFFARLKMVEVELSRASLEQAHLVLEQQFSCGSSCTLTKNGKCLIIGWKGTPIQSVSAWKFV